MAEGPHPAEATGKGRRGPALTCQPQRAGGKGQGRGRRRGGGGGGGRRGREGNGGSEQPGAALRQRRASQLSGPRGDIRRRAEATLGSRSPPRRHGDRARPARSRPSLSTALRRAGAEGPCGAGTAAAVRLQQPESRPLPLSPEQSGVKRTPQRLFVWGNVPKAPLEFIVFEIERQGNTRSVILVCLQRGRSSKSRASAAFCKQAARFEAYNS